MTPLPDGTVPLYYMGTHHYAFRPYHIARVTGMVWHVSRGRMGITLEFFDGKTDWVPFQDDMNGVLGGLQHLIDQGGKV